MTTTHSTSSSAPAINPAKVIFAGICAIILTVGIGRFAYTPLLPLMREQAGLTSVDAGWLATINYVGYLGGALIAASISTLYRKFILYRIGLVVAVLSTLAMGLTQHFWLWLILRLIAGWSSTAGMLLSTGLVLNWLIRQRLRPDLGVHFAGFGMGMVLSGLAVMTMAGHLSWQAQWCVLGAIGIVFLIPSWRWVPAPPQSAAHHGDYPSDPLPSRRWRWTFTLAYFCGGFGYVITATFVVDIIHTMHAITLPGNGVWIVMGLVAIPSCFLWDRVAAQIGGMRALALAYALQTASFALTAIGGSAVVVLLGAVLFGATVIGTVSLTLSIIGRLYPANPAKAMARLTVAYGSAQILGPIVAGYLTHSSGSYRGALLFATGIGTMGTLLAATLARSQTSLR